MELQHLRSEVEVGPFGRIHFAKGDQGLRQLASYLCHIEKITPGFYWDFTRVLYHYNNNNSKYFLDDEGNWEDISDISVGDPYGPTPTFCNTAGCAIGWLTLASDNQFNWSENWQQAEAHFELNHELMSWLFTGSGYEGCMENVTPKQVAYNLMAYVNGQTMMSVNGFTLFKDGTRLNCDRELESVS